jgi:hypothetical protein
MCVSGIISHEDLETTLLGKEIQIRRPRDLGVAAEWSAVGF